MRKILLSIALGLSLFSYGQFKKVELTQDEIQFIAINKGNNFASSISDENFEKLISLNKTPIIYEFIYDNKVIYIGTLNRWYYDNSDFSKEPNRIKASFCLDYSSLDSDLILNILEDRKWKSVKTAQMKSICRDKFELFTFKQGKAYVNDVVKDKITIKFYKLVE